jgi:hypothetical protein
LTYFRKNAQIPDFMKILPVGAEPFHLDRRTDMTKIKSRLSLCCERSENPSIWPSGSHCYPEPLSLWNGQKRSECPGRSSDRLGCALLTSHSRWWASAAFGLKLPIKSQPLETAFLSALQNFLRIPQLCSSASKGNFLCTVELNPLTNPSVTFTAAQPTQIQNCSYYLFSLVM